MNHTSEPPFGPDIASGYVDEPCDDVCKEGFTDIVVLSRSDRNIVARATRHGRRWILKAMAGGGDARGSASLLKEFEIMMSLPREGCVKAFSLEEVDGPGLCIVMEYVEGQTLDEWILQNPPRRERERVARKIIDTVGAIHQAGIVHRDLKPSNIIISAIGNEPVVIDFGLADTCAHTMFKGPGGTSTYMAPEQYAATGRPDPRNDLYSLGVVLGRMGLPRTWRPAIAKCLRPLEERHESARDILTMAGRTRRRTRLAVSVSAAALIISAVTAVALENRTRTMQTEAALAGATQRVDSLDRALHAVRSESDRRVAGLQTALTSVNDSLAAEQMARAQRERFITEAIDRECRELDRIWQNTAMRYLDTVDTKGFVVNAISTWQMDEEAARFISSMEGRLSPNEKIRMRQALDERIRINMEKWMKRREKLNLDY